MKKKEAHKTKNKFNIPIKFVLFLILIITVIAYSNSLNNEILNFDDNEYFSDYPEIVNFEAEHIKTYFSTHYVLMYQPLPILTFALTYKYYGLNPFPYHLVNLIFHLLSIVAVYVFAEKIINNKKTALFTAFLFAIHPMNVEAVSWISARSSGMFVFFYMCSLSLYVKYIKNNFKPYLFVYTLLFFILSLFSKAHAVTLPLVIIIIDIYFKRKWDKRAFFEKIPLFALSLLFGLIAISDRGTTVNILSGLENFSLLDNFFLLTYSLSFYLYRLILPLNLCSVYVYPEKINNFLPLIYYTTPFFLAFIIYMIVKFSRNKRYILFGILFFLATLSLTLQIIPSRLFIVTDRYVYLPYIGLFIIIGQIIFDSKNKPLQKYFIILTIIVGMVFSVLTYNRNKVWANDYTLATDIINKNPEVPYIARAFGVRANFKMNRLKKLNEALLDYNKALFLDTMDRVSYYNRGVLKNHTGDYAGVIFDMERALALGLDFAEMYNFLGAAYYNEGNLGKAVFNFKKAVELNPVYVEAYNNLVAALAATGNFEEANKYSDEVIKIAPENPEIYRNKGILFIKMNQISDACLHFNKAKQLGSTTVDDLLKNYCN